MIVRFWIPGPLTSLTGGKSHRDVKTSGDTLHEALQSLFTAHPGIRDRVLTEQGEIRQHVNVFIGNTEVRLMSGLATRLVDGAEISILPAISGG